MKISGMVMVTLVLITLVLLPIAGCRASVESQEPMEEEVTFQNGDVTLAGTLDKTKYKNNMVLTNWH